MKKAILFFSAISVFLLFSEIATAQTPEISALSLDASTTENLTIDDLICTYTDGASVVETASVWYRNGSSQNTLYLPFEGGAANALLDFSGNDNHASTGDPDEEPSWNATGGRNGTAGAFTFDGNDYLEVASALPLNSSYTKTAWINISGSGFRNIMSSIRNDDNNHHFKIDPDGRLNAGHSFGTAILWGPDSLNHDQWYFVAVSFNYDTGEMILYEDGIEVSRAFVPEALRSVVDPSVLIGAKGYSFEWEGSIDEPRIYDHALSAEQISSLNATGNNLIVQAETYGNDEWYVDITPFSTSQFGDTYRSDPISVQAAEISDLSLDASSTDNLTIDNLLGTFSTNASVNETASAWYKDGTPESLLYLPFEGGPYNTLLDFSGSDNHASMIGNREYEPTWSSTSGYNDHGAFTFDGNDYLMAGNILPLNSPYTKTAWINLSGSGFRNIISSVLHDDNNHHFKVDDDGRLNAGHSFGTFVVRDMEILSTADLWYFVAVTFDYTSGAMILYKDGIEVASGSVPEELRSVVDPSVLIGAMDYSYEFEGSIDEPRIFDHVLTLEQINAMYTTGNNIVVPEETTSGEEWHVDVTPFAIYEVGATYTSNTLTVRSVVVTTIADQTVSEGSSFSTFDLDDHVSDYEFADNELVWSSTGSSELIVTINPSTHVATVGIPDVNWYGAEDISFIATNPIADSDTAVVTFTVQNINDTPILTTLGPQDVTEDNTLTGLSVVFTDADPTDSHTILVTSDEANVIVTDPSGNTSGSTYDLVPAADWNGSAQITVTVTDDGAGEFFDTETYTLTVHAANDAPVLTTLGPQDVTEDNTLSGLSVVFTDIDLTDTHTILVTSDETNVAVTDPSGNTSGSTYDLVPAADWNGSAQITVTVTDDGAGEFFDTETYTLTVHAANDAPVLTTLGAQDVTEDNTLSGLSVVFTDIDLTDTHTITVTSDEANVTVTDPSGNTSGSTYDLVPAADWNGTAQITVTVTDDGTVALFDTETYTLTVHAANDEPVLTTLGAQEVNEGNTLSGLSVVFTDIDLTDTHTITVTSDEANVIVTGPSGNTSGSTYDLVPAADWNGSAQITVTVSDDGTVALFDTEIYTLTVHAANDAPVLTTLGAQDVNEDNTLSGLSVVFTDIDLTDTHTITVTSDEANVAVTGPSGNTSGSIYDLVPAADWNGSAQITVTVTDDGTGALFDTETYTLTVHAANDAPVLTTLGPQDVNEDNTLSGLSVVFTDIDLTDTHTITVTSDETNVTVTGPSGNTSGSTYDLVPAADWNGTAQITVTVTDDGTVALFDTETYTLTVHAANDAPVLTTLGAQEVNEDNTLSGLSVVFTDIDLTDTHTITVTSDETNVAVTGPSGNTSGSTYDLVPVADWNGSAQITVTVTDDGTVALFDTETYTLTVHAANDAPVLTTLGPQDVNEDNTLSGLSVVFTDIDPTDTHTITVTSDETNVAVTGPSGNTSGSTYDLVPAADWNGSAQITVTVTDDGAGEFFDTETYTLTVHAANDAPVLTTLGPQDVNEDNTLSGLSVIFTDIDPTDTHTITVTSDEANVTVTGPSGNTSGSTYDLVPAADWNGTAQITVTVTDNGTVALFDTETYTLTVHAANDAPVLTTLGPQDVNEDNTLSGLSVVFTDVDPTDTHTITVTSDEANVTVTGPSGNTSGSTFDLVPAADWNGTTQITITVVENGSVLNDTEIFTLTVNAVNDAPDALALSNTNMDERVVPGTEVGLFTTTDVDDVTHQYGFISDGGVNDVDNSAFTISGNTLTTNVELDYEVKSSYSILVQTSDGNGGSTSQHFTITINDIDETSVEDIYNNPAFNVYPVPAIDNVTVEIDNPENMELLLEIYSNSGRLVHEEMIYSKTKIDLTGFTDGMYILSIKGEQVYGTRKIIVKDR